MSHIFLHRGDTPFGILCTFGQKKKVNGGITCLSSVKLGLPLKDGVVLFEKVELLAKWVKLHSILLPGKVGKIRSFIHSIFFLTSRYIKGKYIKLILLDYFFGVFFSKVLFFNHILGSKVQDDER